MTWNVDAANGGAVSRFGLPVVPVVEGLEAGEQELLGRMWGRLRRVRANNRVIDAYYDQHKFFHNLGISVPDKMAATQAALDWPSKAVQSLARKHVFEGFSLDGVSNPWGVGQVLAANQFGLCLSQAINSAYKYGCAFLVVTRGDEEAGDPPVVVQARDALWATGVWDQRRQRLSAAMLVLDADEHARPRVVLLITSRDVVEIEAGPEGGVVSRRYRHGLSRLPVEMLAYDPQLGRPFGRSRITRTVRYLTDVAARTLVRAETSAEFFAAPQRYVLGADPDAFADMDSWKAVTGRLLALATNEEGATPTAGTFPQVSMEPHLAMYRQLAQNFCAATSLPQSSVGLFADNPASAEAMQAAEYALSDEAEYQWQVFTPALRRVVEDVVMLRDGLDAPPEGSWRVDVGWKPARYVSPQAAADSIVKLVQALPQVAGTQVALKRAGFSASEISEIEATATRQRAETVLDRLEALANKDADSDTTGQEAPPDDS